MLRGTGKKNARAGKPKKKEKRGTHLPLPFSNKLTKGGEELLRFFVFPPQEGGVGGEGEEDGRCLIPFDGSRGEVGGGGFKLPEERSDYLSFFLFVYSRGGSKGEGVSALFRFFPFDFYLEKKKKGLFDMTFHTRPSCGVWGGGDIAEKEEEIASVLHCPARGGKKKKKGKTAHLFNN